MQRTSAKMFKVVSKGMILLASLTLVLFTFSCTDVFDWKTTKFPCSQSRVCMTGYTCSAGVCIPTGSTPTDGGDKPDKPIVTDGRYRPAIAAPKVAFLYVGPVGDFGWTWTHEQGRLHLKKLGYKTTAVGPVSVKDSSAQMEKFIKDGYNIIVGTSFDFLVPSLTTSSKHPTINFLECSGFQTSKNMGSYFGRLYQVEWLAGMIAGSMTKTNIVGILATVPIPEVVRHINAFANGVKYVNPKAVVVVEWVGNWFDPKNEPILTQKLLDANTDVIHSHTDTSIPLELIENKKGEPLTTKDGSKVYTIGYNASNACKFGPRTCLSSAYWNWGPILERILNKIKKGTWDPSEIIWEQIKNDKNLSSFHMTDLSSVIPGSARIQIESLVPKLAESGQKGQQLPFAGPLKDNTGKQRLSKGKYLTDKALLNMCWYVDGVVESDGTTPAKVPSGCKGDR